jgi:predicted SAM-dependent methyltransferase
LKNIGSNIDFFSCELCGCNDRERHIVLYFNQLNLWKTLIHEKKILHFAPEACFISKLRKLANEYHMVDLNPKDDSIQQMDSQNILFPDNYFDFIMCNHVLEHVYDDRLAMRELCRVLKPGGYGVVQTPFSSILASTFQDSGINTDELRHRFYGQSDHIRVYGQDLFRRFVESGFQLNLKHHKVVLANFNPVVYGVNPSEDLILLKKPEMV